MDFIITVDVEADNQWQRPSGMSVENIKFLARFQDLCQKYNFPPTYFVTHEVASSQDSVDILKKFQKNGAEIGAHLHPWSTPPFFNSIDFELNHHRFPSELSKEELNSKLKNLTDLITKNFNTKPTSFRAGRWGVNEEVVLALEKNAYLVDSSVTPKINWLLVNSSEDTHSPDFSEANIYPYFPDYNNMLIAGESSVLEVPMTILYTGIFSAEKNIFSNYFVKMPNSFFKKLLNHIFFRQKWLRIFHNSKTKDWEAVYKSAVVNNLPVLEFMIHSSELMPGASPYAKTADSVDVIYSKLESMFKFFQEKNLQGETLTSFAIKYKKYEK